MQNNNIQWYYVKNGIKQGPINNEEFQDLVINKIIEDNTLVWNQKMDNWKEYKLCNNEPSVITEIIAEEIDNSEMYCFQCGKVFQKEKMFRYNDNWICEECNPVFVKNLSKSIIKTHNSEYGGFWVRYFAKMIDIFFICLIIFAYKTIIWSISLLYPISSFSYIILDNLYNYSNVFISAFYSIIFVGKYGATPGKMFYRLKIVNSDKTEVSYLTAAGRHFSEYLSSLILCIGYIIAVFDLKRRTLHDRICNTLVIRY